MIVRLSLGFTLAAAVVSGFGAAGCSSSSSREKGRGGCIGADCAIVVTSYFGANFSGTGTINTVTTDTPATITSNLDSTLDPDVSIQITGDDALFLNKDTGSIRRYDLTDFEVQGEYPTGDSVAPNSSSYPQDLLEIPGSKQVFVTLSGNQSAQALGVLDVSGTVGEDASVNTSAGAISYINLPTVTGDSDGEPNAANLYFCNGLVYVVQQNYSYDASYVVTYQTGSIAIVDPVGKDVVGSIALAGKNPGAIVAAVPGKCDTVLVADSSGLTTVPDGTGGIEKVDLTNKKSLGMLATDKALSGRPSLLAIQSSTLGFVTLYFDPQPNALGEIFLASVKVSSFNPQTGALIADVTPKKAGQIDFAKISSDGQLWVGVGPYAGESDPTKLSEGLYRGRADGTMLPATPLSGEATDGGSPAGVLANIPSAIAFE